MLGECGSLVGVVEVDWRRSGAAFGPAVDLAVALVGGGCQWYIAIWLA
jgi:hypothetical protein